MATFEHVTFIRATPERVWDALTSEQQTADFWGHSNVSDWQVGSPWEHRRIDGSGVADVEGEVTEAQRPTRLAMTFGEGTVAAFDIEGFHDIVRLVITHTDLPEDQYDNAAHGWASVAANLKTLLETGRTLPQPPWKMNPRRS